LIQFLGAHYLVNSPLKKLCFPNILSSRSFLWRTNFHGPVTWLTHTERSRH